MILRSLAVRQCNHHGRPPARRGEAAQDPNGEDNNLPTPTKSVAQDVQTAVCMCRPVCGVGSNFGFLLLLHPRWRAHGHCIPRDMHSLWDMNPDGAASTPRSNEPKIKAKSPWYVPISSIVSSDLSNWLLAFAKSQDPTKLIYLHLAPFKNIFLHYAAQNIKISPHLILYSPLSFWASLRHGE